MNKEKVKQFLDKYEFKYSEKENFITVKLELAQQVEIDFNKPNKIIIKDKLVGWNFLTGMIGMSLKNALIYNFIGIMLFGFICLYAEIMSDNILNFLSLFLVFISWIVLFTSFYLIKLEIFKSQIINWTKE
ncbi:MAG: hypothetical protein WCO13_04075 [Bacteroidota bacterium]